MLVKNGIDLELKLTNCNNSAHGVCRDLEQRQNLRQDFWATIDSYLRDLECPENYLNDSQGSWRRSPKQRTWIVYWLLSCAISEAYVEDKETPTEDSSTLPTQSEPMILPEKVDDFPLGFSTGDALVDRALTVLRMQFLLEIEKEQQEQNEVLAQKIQETIQKNRSKPKEEAQYRNRRKQK